MPESYEERKMDRASWGQLVPAFKHSSLKGAPMSRQDRRGNDIGGKDKKKFHLTYID